jgi:hypothetical protein
MTGLEELVRMRLEGRVPSLLYVELDVGRIPGEGNLFIKNEEPVHSIDLRAVQGLVVSVSGCNSERVKLIASACEENGARRVIANISDALPNSSFEVIEVMDTEGWFTWKK